MDNGLARLNSVQNRSLALPATQVSFSTGLTGQCRLLRAID
jgi:hypothetical protein